MAISSWGSQLNKEFASKLRSVGILVTLAAIIWWAAFFGHVAQMAGDAPEVVLQNRYQCIVYTTTPCTIIYGVAQFAGYTHTTQYLPGPESVSSQ
jgi:hypothetical protein